MNCFLVFEKSGIVWLIMTSCYLFPVSFWLMKILGFAEISRKLLPTNVRSTIGMIEQCSNEISERKNLAFALLVKPFVMGRSNQDRKEV